MEVIETYSDLIAFISREDVPLKLAEHVISQFLKVWSVGEHTKETLIEATKEHIETISKNPNAEHPLFLFCDLDVIE